jgi:hypothetical protein
MANQPFGRYRSYAMIDLPASSACNDSAEKWADARAPSCLRVQKSLRTARSRRNRLSFQDPERVPFPGCAAKAALRANLERRPTQRWIIDSNTGSYDQRQPALLLSTKGAAGNMMATDRLRAPSDSLPFAAVPPGREPRLIGGRNAAEIRRSCSTLRGYRPPCDTSARYGEGCAY